LPVHPIDALRRPKGELRWEKLLAVSAALFAHKSYHGTSLDDIAQELGIKKTSLYHYVGSKEAILNAVYNRMMERAEAAILPITKLALSPDERLRRMVHAYVFMIASDVDTWSLLHYAQNALGPENLRTLLRRKREYERRFEKVIEEGQAKNLFRRLPKRLLVLGIFGAANYVHYWLRFTKFTPEQVAAGILDMLELGWTIEEGATGMHQREIGGALTAVATTLEQLGIVVERLKTALAKEERSE
jgi:AcrR family transcriptional regulator